jgi:predicted XRE-type DNA-binding protein
MVKINKIESLVWEDGTVCTNMEENHSEVQNFYQALYHSQGFREMDELLDVVQPKVSDLMNEDLDKLYTEEEV